jgi:hypothetical protein
MLRRGRKENWEMMVIFLIPKMLKELTAQRVILIVHIRLNQLPCGALMVFIRRSNILA